MPDHHQPGPYRPRSGRDPCEDEPRRPSMVRNTLEVLIGVLNGAVGDYLKRTDNGLATPMTLVHEDRPLALTRASLAAAYPAASPP